MSEVDTKKRLGLWQIVAWLMRYVKPYRFSFVLFIGISLVEIFIGLIVPWSMKILVDNVLGDESLPKVIVPIVNAFSLTSKTSLLVGVCIGGLLIGLFSDFISLVHTQMQVGIGQKMVLDAQRDLFAHLQKLSLRYHQEAGTGDSIYRIDADVFCVDSIIMTGVFPLVSSFLTLVFMFVILFQIEWTLALLSLIVMPPMLLVIDRYSGRLSERTEEVKEMESGIYNLVYEVFSSIKLVKAFSRENYEHQRFSEQGTKAYKARLNVTFQESFFSFIVSALTYIGTTVVLGVGGYHVLQGTLTIGELLVVLAYLGSVYGPLSSISHTVGNLQGSLTSARRIHETMSLQPEIEDVSDAIKVENPVGNIKFENVNFAYNDDRPILRNINFEVNAGEMLAVVGLTGAGKSTLVSLIPRFYETSGGVVRIDGVDVREMQLKSLREAISVVTQEPILFSASVGENIKYGKLNATQTEIIEAAKAAQAHEFIEKMSEGYETELGDSGSQLSGGERQRVSIARALLKNAPILILDEPTSALDSRSESKIFSALRSLMKNRTTIVIAHRLSTIRDADKIIVIDGGEIVGQGNHEQLLRENELYRELYERLLQGFGFDTETKSAASAEIN